MRTYHAQWPKILAGRWDGKECKTRVKGGNHRSVELEKVSRVIKLQLLINWNRIQYSGKGYGWFRLCTVTLHVAISFPLCSLNLYAPWSKDFYFQKSWFFTSSIYSTCLECLFDFCYSLSKCAHMHLSAHPYIRGTTKGCECVSVPGCKKNHQLSPLHFRNYCSQDVLYVLRSTGSPATFQLTPKTAIYSGLSSVYFLFVCLYLSARIAYGPNRTRTRYMP